MKKILFAIITMAVILQSFIAHAETQQKVSVVDSLTAKMPEIERIKREMLEMKDTFEFYFSGDTKLEECDPHAFWLMNRMMQMVQSVQTHEDAWAWMLAMNECVEEYNSRLERKYGSPQAAITAVNELITVYGAGNQPMMNTTTYVKMISAHYLTLYEYSRIMLYIKDYNDENDDDIILRNLYYREFKEWFDVNNAINGIMYFYSYSLAWYSSMPMDINSTFRIWSENRLEELKIEEEIFEDYDFKPFKSDAKKTSDRKFDKLIKYFKEISKEKVIKELVDERGYDSDPEFMEELVNERMDFDKTSEMIAYYETAIVNWRNVREEIAEFLPKEKRKSYREITKQVYTRLYKDLEEMKELNI